MGISQQTFSRVLKAARKAVSEGVVKGRIIKVKGGDFKLLDGRRRPGPISLKTTF